MLRACLLATVALAVAACSGQGGETSNDSATGSSVDAVAPSGRASRADDESAQGDDDADEAGPDDDAAAASGLDSGAGQAPVEPIRWTDCDGGLQCGSVPVPLDYRDPDGPLIEIALVRRPATGNRTGSIFVNPGGPGASGIEFVRGGFRFDDATAERYDVVGFDPRGIGESNPLSCSVDRGESAMADLSPDTAQESTVLDREAAEIVNDCTDSDATLLPHLTTVNVARDLDRLRQAVGDERLHYYGLSYGTLLAVRYGELFPDDVGHMVLDGVVDPNADLPTLLRQQAVAFETTFEQLDDRCGDVRCPPDGITATFDRVLDRLEADGPVGDVGSSELIVASLLPAYSPSVLPAYAVSLEQADNGTYAAIEMLSDFFVEAVSFTAYAAFACADGRPPEGTDAWDRFAAELDEAAPRFGAVVANELRVCALWPAPVEEVTDVSTDTLQGVSVPILVIGNTGDAATPLENAELVATLLPESRLVVVDSTRHTAYNGSACVRQLVADYFADQTLADSSRCASG